MVTYITSLCRSLLLCAALSSAAFAAWQPSLSSDDLALATKLADPHIGHDRHRTAVAGNGAQIEVLLIEVRETKNKTNNSIVEVFTFDYSTGLTWLHIIDLESAHRISSQQLTDSYLPLNDNEIDQAIRQIQQDPTTMAAVRQEYFTQFGENLADLSRLDMKVSVWQPRNKHSNNLCVNSRCALISVFTHDHYNFSVEPIVDLMTGEIHHDLLAQE